MNIVVLLDRHMRVKTTLLTPAILVPLHQQLRCEVPDVADEKGAHTHVGAIYLLMPAVLIPLHRRSWMYY
jgi:hypothetical protein